MLPSNKKHQTDSGESHYLLYERRQGIDLALNVNCGMLESQTRSVPDHHCQKEDIR